MTDNTVKPYQKISPHLVATLFVSVLIMSAVYWLTGVHIFHSSLEYRSYLIFTSILAIVIVGGYQLFFWTEYNNTKFKKINFHISLDDRIPFLPEFIWIYSLSYYAVIGLVVSTLPTLEKGLEYIFGGVVLLTIQCFIFYFFPSTVPESWRNYKSNTRSKKFLHLVQALDSGRNCMPSMHMSVTTYVSLLLYPAISYYAFLFILIIAVSCLVVKQHVLLDLPPGILLGWLVYVIVL